MHKLDASHSLGVQVRLGSRHSLVNPALGNVLLAEKCESDVHEIWKNTGVGDDSDLAALHIKLEAARKKGYAFDREESEVGVIAVAVPVYDRFRKVVASLSLSMPTARYSEEICNRYIALLHQAASAISSKLGCKNYPHQQSAA